MSYFKYFPKINYKFSSTDFFTKEIINLTAVPKIIDSLSDKEGVYIDYTIKDGERPEFLANKFYGSPTYHWIILLSNQILNPYFDWPLDTYTLDKYIESYYPGTAIFFPASGTETRFTKKDTNSKLLFTDSYFSEGSEITQENRTGEVYSWDPTLRKLIVINSDDSNYDTENLLYGTNSVDNFEIIPSKVVLYNSESVHHFVDDFGNYLDPYGKININQYSDQKIYSEGNIFFENVDGYETLTDSNNYALNRYLNGSFVANTITNKQHEYNVNDLKRNIKILRKEYLNNIEEDLENIFK